MKIRAKLPYRLVRAFAGQDFVNYEWRPVPEGGEEEARRLEAAGYAELLIEEPVIEYPSMLNEPIRLTVEEIVEVNATPGAVKLAEKYGLDLELLAIEGSGADGRILKGDVEAAITLAEEEE